MKSTLYWHYRLGGRSCAHRPPFAETTRTFELEGFGHFLDGNPESTAVTEDGAVALRPGRARALLGHGGSL